MRETPRPGGARTGGHGPTARPRLSAGAGLHAVGHAIETNIALPIEPAKSLVTRPEASPVEKRQWVNDEAYIFAWAGAGGFLGAALQGRIAGLVGFAIAGYYTAWRVTRRQS